MWGPQNSNGDGLDGKPGSGEPGKGSTSTNYLTGQASVIGTKYGDLNQDAVFLKRITLGASHPNSDPPEVILALVLDGHGMLGEVASSAAGEVISSHIESALVESGEASLRDIGRRRIKEIINEAFQKAHAYVLGLYNAAPPEYHFPFGPGETKRCTFTLTKQGSTMVYHHPYAGSRLVEFGTTASLTLVEKGHLVVAHVGDSDIVVGALESGFVVATEMTKPHSGINVSEQFRIGELLGDNEALLQVANLRDDGYLEVTNLGGSNSSVALGMTRAVGHYHLENYGVISRPEIRFYDIRTEDVCVILATDGVWDAMHPRDAVQFVCEEIISMGKSEETAALHLCETCVRMQIESHGTADNTSAVVISMPHWLPEVKPADQQSFHYAI